jgi:glycosyltransferase involved in cell wall biosynthesis
MKILILSDDFPPDVVGGAGMMALRFAREFIEFGHTVHVVTSTNSYEKRGTRLVDGIIVTNIYSPYYSDRWRSFRSLYNPGVMRDLKNVILKFKPDIVHAHIVHLYLSFYSLIVAKRFAKVFMTAHDVMPFYPGTLTEFINQKDLSCPKYFDYRISSKMLIRKFRFRYNPFRNVIIRNILRRIDGVVAVSYELKEALSQNGIPVCEVIYNGVEAHGWDVSLNDVEAFKKGLGLVGSEVVLFGGRLSGAKGGSLILDAMSNILKQVPSAKLLVVGKNDHYAERMMRKATDLGISDCVIFAGWLKEGEMKKAYASAAVVTTPSVCFDSFPNGNIEAFASGKPVVSTCFGGSREVIKDGKNGYIVNPFDVQTLSKAITDLLLNKAKAEIFGGAGRALIKEKYTIKDSSNKYLSLFAK